MRSSLKISNRIDMSGKKVVFNTKETANKAPVKRVVNRKFNMNKMAKNALGSIPSCVFVNGSLDQRMGMEFLKMGQGSIPTVTGSLIKTELNKSGEKTMGIKDINYVLYHDTTGVRTVAKASSKSGNNVSSDIKNAESNGWAQTEIGWMYNENGKPVTGWKQIDGKWYYFETNGVMQTGWHTIDGKIYYFHSKDDMAESEWIQDKTNKNWYYIKSNGEIAKSEWRQDSVGKWYYVRSNGQMVKSEWRQDSAGKWYYLGSNGEMVTSQMVRGADGKNYYLGEDGAMVVNKDITWEGTTYHVDGNGVCSLSSGQDVDEKIEKFMEGTAEIGNWYTKNITTYLNGEIVKGDRTRSTKECELINNIEVGDDCSAFVSACLCKYGILTNTWYGSFAYNKNSASREEELINALEKAGFVWHTKDNNYIPKRGDILVQHEHYGKEDVKHVEIVDSYDGKGAQVWSWGKVYKSLPTLRTKTDLYGRTSGYWRIEK